MRRAAGERDGGGRRRGGAKLRGGRSSSPRRCYARSPCWTSTSSCGEVRRLKAPRRSRAAGKILSVIETPLGYKCDVEWNDGSVQREDAGFMNR
eukprot:80084-Hanusia_phi.AAC.2